MFHFVLGDPIFFNTLVIFASLFILFKAADLIVYGIEDYAKKLGLSNYIIGLVVVAFAASMPEMISSLAGLVMGEEGVAFGAILGTNMVHMALVVGVLCVVGKKLDVECKILEKRKLVVWALLMLPFVLMLDSELSRADGILLIAAFCFYIFTLWRMEGTLGKLKKQVKFKNIWRDVFIFCGALVALLLAGRWLVFSSVQIAQRMGISPYFIAITVIAIGSTIPDFAGGLRSVLRKAEDIAIGDILGSTVIELLLFFGVVALVHPLKIPLFGVLNAMAFLVVCTTAMMWFIQKKTMTWKHGVFLLFLYAAFLTIEIIKIT